MPTWADVRTYARERYQPTDDVDDRVSLVLALEGGRTQQLVLRPVRAMDTDWIEFRLPVAREANIPHAEALARNATMPVGALALEEGLYILVYRIPLEYLDVHELDPAIIALNTLADDIELAATKADEF